MVAKGGHIDFMFLAPLLLTRPLDPMLLSNSIPVTGSSSQFPLDLYLIRWESTCHSLPFIFTSRKFSVRPDGNQGDRLVEQSNKLSYLERAATEWKLQRRGQKTTCRQTQIPASLIVLLLIVQVVGLRWETIKSPKSTRLCHFAVDSFSTLDTGYLL